MATRKVYTVTNGAGTLLHICGTAAKAASRGLKAANDDPLARVYAGDVKAVASRLVARGYTEVVRKREDGTTEYTSLEIRYVD